MRRRLLVVLSAALILVGLSSCTPTTPDEYVALGDSYVAGPLIPVPRGNPPGCLRSNRNYPSLVRPTLGLAEFTDVSCSGATTDDITAPQDTFFGGTAPPQIDAVDGGTAVVTLGIGGNDIGFTDIVINCVRVAFLQPPCRDDYVRGGQDELSARIAATAPKVDRVVDVIRERAPQADIHVVGYPAILPDSGRGCYPVVPILAEDVAYLRGKNRELNAMLSQVAAANGVSFIDLYRPSIGHDLCQIPGVKWIEGLVPTAPAAPVHPNALGMQGAANTVGPRLRAGLAPAPAPAAA